MLQIGQSIIGESKCDTDLPEQSLQISSIPQNLFDSTIGSIPGSNV